MKIQFITNQTEIEQIITSCPTCVVSMCDKDGNPYAVPMNFGYKDGVLYFHSAQEGQKIECLRQNSSVCVTFVPAKQDLVYHNVEMPCSYSMHSKSAVAFGNVEFVEDIAEKEAIFQVFMAHYSDRAFKFGIPALNHVKVWKMVVKSLTAKEFGLRQRPYSGD